MSNYTMTLKTKSTCPMKSTVVSMIDMLETGAWVKEKMVIGPKEEGRYTIYMNNVSDDTLVAFITEMKDDKGNDVKEEDIEKMIAYGEYEVRISSRRGNNLFATMVVDDGETTADSTAVSSLESAIKEAASRSGRSVEDVRVAVDQMVNERYDKDLILEILSKYRSFKKPVRKPSCIWVDPYEAEAKRQGMDSMQARVSAHLVSGYPVMLQGPKSTGKDTFAENEAFKHGRPVYRLVMNRDLMLEDIFGGKTTDASSLAALKADGIKDLALAYMRVQCDSAADLSDYEKAAKYELLKARAASTNIVMEDSEVYEWAVNGGFLIIDEFNYANPNTAAAFLNPLLDNTGYIVIPGRGEVPLNPDCVVICTQNEDYNGTEEQNEATISRLDFFDFKQPKDVTDLLVTATEAELKKLGVSGKPSKEMVQQANRFYKQIMSMWEAGNITSQALNIRGITRSLAMATKRPHAKLWHELQYGVVNGCSAQERGVVLEILKSHVTL